MPRSISTALRRSEPSRERRSFISSTITNASYMQNDKEMRPRYSILDLSSKIETRNFDYAPTNMSTEFSRAADEIGRSVLSIYGESGQGEDISPMYRVAIDATIAASLGLDYRDVSKNHKYFVNLFAGEDVEDRGFGEALAKAWEIEGVSQDIASLQNDFDRSDDEDERRVILEEIEALELKSLQLQDYSNRGWLKNNVVNATPIIRQASKTIAWTAVGAALGAGIGGLFAGTATTANSVGNIIKAITLLNAGSKGVRYGAVAGRVADGVINTVMREKGNMSRQLYNMTDENGNRISDDIRIGASSMYGIFAGLVEYFLPEPGLETIVPNGLSQLVKKSLGDVIQNGVLRFGARLGLGALSESTEEAVQSIIGDLATTAAKAASDAYGVTTFKGRSLEEAIGSYLKNAWQSFSEAFIPSLIAGAPGTFISGMREMNISKNYRLVEATPDQKASAKQFQTFGEDAKVVPVDIVKFQRRKPSESFISGITTKSENGEGTVQTNGFDPVRVKTDSSGRFVPVDTYNNNLAKYLRDLGAKGIAVEIVESGERESVRLESSDISNAARNAGGMAVDESDVVFRTQDDANAFISSLGDSVERQRNEDGTITYEYTDKDGNRQTLGITVDENAEITSLTAEEAKLNETTASPPIEAEESTATTETNAQDETASTQDQGEAELSREIRRASRGHITKNAADALARLFYILPEDVRNTIFQRNNGRLVISDSEYERITGRKVGTQNRAISRLNSLQMVLTGKSDASSFVHEMGHIVLLAHPELADGIRLAFAVNLDTEEGLDTFLSFINENSDIINVKSRSEAIELLHEIGNIDTKERFSENAEELVMEMLEAHFRADVRKRNLTSLPQNVQEIFQKVANAIRRVYGKATGKTELPQDVQDAFNSFFWGGEEATSPSTNNTGSDVRFQSAILPNLNDEIDSLSKADIGKPNATIRFSNSTPEVFVRLGFPNLPVEAFRDKLARGLFNKEGKSHGHAEGIDKDIVKQVAANIADPLYVFRSTNGKDLVAVYSVLDKKGNPLMVSLRAEQTANRIDINLITSLYGRPSHQLQNWVNQGLLLYWDNLDNSEAALAVRLQLPSGVTASNSEALNVRLQLPSVVTSENTILTKSDIVNEEDMRSQRALSANTVEEGEQKLMDMDEERFTRCIEKDIFLPAYAVKAKVNSENKAVADLAKRELNDRDKISLLSEAEREAISDTDSAEEYVNRMKSVGELHLATEEETERVYRKAWNYAHVLTPKEAASAFKARFNTLPRLLELKQLLGPRRIQATDSKGNTFTRMYVPVSNSFYSQLSRLNENSTIDEVNAVLSAIDSNPRSWLKAYQEAMRDGRRISGTLSEDQDIIDAYVDMADADFSIISDELRNGREPDAIIADSVYGIPSSDIMNLSVDSADSDAVAAGNTESELSEDVSTDKAKSLKRSRDRALKAEEAARQTVSELEEEIRAQGVQNPRIGELQERLEKAKREASAQKRRADKLDRRLKALATRTTSERISRAIRAKLRLNYKTHDVAIAEQPLYYVYYLMHNGQNRRFSESPSTESMPVDDWDIEVARKGLVEGVQSVNEDGSPVDVVIELNHVDKDGNPVLVYSGNLGAYRYVRQEIPAALKNHLSAETIERLETPGALRWNQLTVAEKQDIYKALTAVKHEAAVARSETVDRRMSERRTLAREAAKSVLGADIGKIDDEMRQATKEWLQRNNPDYNGATPTDTEVWDYISKHPQEFMDSVELNKAQKGYDVYRLSFLKIQRIADILDGGKENGPFQRIFVRPFMEAYDRVMANTDRRAQSFQNELEKIIGKQGSKKYSEAMERLRKETIHLSTRAIKGTGRDLKLMEAMGVYIYSQNINGLTKLISADGNSLTLESVARINPEAVLKFIKMEEAMRADSTRDKDHPTPLNGEKNLESIREKIESGEIKSVLPDWVADIGDMMINELSKEMPRVAEVAYNEYNTMLQIQDRYFPLVRSNRGSIGDIFGSPFKGKNAKVNNGSIQTRQSNARYPLMLDPFTVFMSAIREQENLINMTKPVADASYLLNYGNLGQIVSNRFGDKWVKALRDYLLRMASQEDHLTDIEKMVNRFLGNAAAAKIGLNLMTGVKQFVSLIPATLDGELSPADVLNGIKHVLSKKDRTQTRELMDKMAYSVLRSGYNTEISRLQHMDTHTRLGEMNQKAIELSTWLVQHGDSLSKMIIWYAKFDKEMRKGKVTESDAAYAATDLINRTMSVTNPVSLSEMQSKKGTLQRVYFMFSNDLFQMWNILFGDLPIDIKNKRWGRAFVRFGELGLTAATLGLLAGGWLPDKDDDDEPFSLEDFLGDFLENLLGYVPLAGNLASDWVRGYSQSFISLPGEGISLAKMAYKGAIGDKDYSPDEYYDQIIDTLFSVGELAGIPATGLKRPAQAFYDFDEGEWRLNLAYLFGVTWGEGWPNFSPYLRELVN